MHKGFTVFCVGDNDISALYAVHYLPTRYLIDNEGRIIGKMENEEELAAKLKEIFQE